MPAFQSAYLVSPENRSEKYRTSRPTHHPNTAIPPSPAVAPVRYASYLTAEENRAVIAGAVGVPQPTFTSLCAKPARHYRSAVCPSFLLSATFWKQILRSKYLAVRHIVLPMILPPRTLLPKSLLT